VPTDSTDSTDPTIRPATGSDCAAVAALHAANWQNHYRDILPDAYLDGEAPAERLGYWQRAFDAAGGAPEGLLVASDGRGGLTGFVSLLRGTEEGVDALIDNLHVRGDQQGRGTGRALIAAAVERLIADGASSVCLWVFDGNADAMGFYTRLGGVADRHGTDPFAGADAPDTRLVWRDLPALLGRCRR